MKIHVSRREVMNNVIRFRDNILTLKEKAKQHKQTRLYHALLNRKTGDIHFFDASAKKSQKHTADWQEIQIAVDTESQNKAHFEVRDQKNHNLQSKDLEPLAWSIIYETLEALNHMASLHPAKAEGVLPEQAAVQDLSQVELSIVKGAIEEMEGWKGDIDRFVAEKLLKQSPVGTYLLRDAGSLAQISVKYLSEANKSAVKPYICTFVDDHKKISEVLILHTDNGWIVYQDNPDLSDSQYRYVTSAHEVLRHLHQKAKWPLK